MRTGRDQRIATKMTNSHGGVTEDGSRGASILRARADKGGRAKP